MISSLLSKLYNKYFQCYYIYFNATSFFIIILYFTSISNAHLEIYNGSINMFTN